MIEERLKQSFDRYGDSPPDVWRGFASLCEEVVFKKNQVIKAGGQIERYGYFLLSGSCGVFLWKESGFVCLDIVLENDFFADHFSLITGDPSPLETVALEKTVALRISKTNMEKMRESHMGAMLFLLGAEHSFVEKQRQQIDLLTKTAEQRYADLLQKNPQIVQRIAQKHVASYLGITTQSLSRIRRKI